MSFTFIDTINLTNVVFCIVRIGQKNFSHVFSEKLLPLEEEDELQDETAELQESIFMNCSSYPSAKFQIQYLKNEHVGQHLQWKLPICA